MAVLDIHISDAYVAMAAPAPSPRAIAANGRANVDYFPTLTTIVDAVGGPARIAGQPSLAIRTVTVTAV